MREPNSEKLNALVGKLVGDLGVSLGGASILLGDRLGLYKAMRAVRRSRHPSWRRLQACTSAMCANGCPGRPHRDTSTIILKRARSRSRPSKR
jgi:hypothetical protein